MRRAPALSVFAAACLLLPRAAAGGESTRRCKLAVVDIHAEGTDPALASNLTTLLAVEAQSLGVFDVTTREDIAAMLSLEMQRQLVGCDDAGCLAEIGGALGVERMLAGKLGQIGDTYLLTLSILRVKGGAEVEARAVRQVTGQQGLIEAARGALREVGAKVAESLTGFVEVKVEQPEAEIRVAGKLVCVSPCAPILHASGPHELRVSKKGFIDWAKEITIPPARQTERVFVVMVPSPEFRAAYTTAARSTRRRAWATLLGGVLAGGGAGTLYALAAKNARLNDNAWNAAEHAREQNDTATMRANYDTVERTARNGRLQQWSSFGLAGVGGILLVTGVVLFATGDAPGRYER